MTTAAVIQQSPSIANAAGRLFGSSPGLPLTTDITATPVSNPESPSANRGKSSTLMIATAPMPVPLTGVDSRYHSPY